MSVVIFLQNAWSPVYAGRLWPRESWLRALVESRSGQRLKCLAVEWSEVENVTPEVGSHPDSIMAPNREHVLAILKARKPDVVIACGRIPERCLTELWSGPLMALPHPAHRVLTNALYLKANAMLVDGFSKRIALRQKRGKVLIEKI